MPVNDLTGRRFVRLTVKTLAGIRNSLAYWNCECDCGKSIEVCGKYLTRGSTVSCGCYRSDPEVRRAARLQMEPEDRVRAARGEHVTPEKPPVIPRTPVTRVKKILPLKPVKKVEPVAPPAPQPAPASLRTADLPRVTSRTRQKPGILR